MSTPLTYAVADYCNIAPGSDIAVEWKAELWKDGATWSWFTTNPVGGGFGSNAVTSQSDAIARAITNVPRGEAVHIYIDDADRGVYVRGL
jgi:hypothetical protein